MACEKLISIRCRDSTICRWRIWWISIDCRTGNHFPGTNDNTFQTRTTPILHNIIVLFNFASHPHWMWLISKQMNHIVYPFFEISFCLGQFVACVCVWNVNFMQRRITQFSSTKYGAILKHTLIWLWNELRTNFSPYFSLFCRIRRNIIVVFFLLHSAFGEHTYLKWLEVVYF